MVQNLPNIPSIQNQKQVNFQQNQTPVMQGAAADVAKQKVDNSYIAKRANASAESNPLATLGLGTAIWYGLAQGMDKFNPKCEGEYSKTILGKLGAWGDKVSSKGIGKKINDFIRWLNVKTYKMSKKSKIMYTLRNHSTSPEWSFAKVPGAGLKGFLAMDTENIFKEFMKPITHRKPTKLLGFIPLGKESHYFQALEQYGVDQKYINKFIDSVKNLDFPKQALALQKEELKLLGASADIVAKIEAKTGLTGLEKYAKSLKVKKLGFKSLREFNALEGKYLENSGKILDALKKADPKIKVSIWRGSGTWGKIKSHLFGRTASLSEYRNKYIATLGKGNKTYLGRALPKALGWFTEGCTNRFAGGKLAVAMQAGIFADMLYQTIKAPKGEKIKTFGERFVNDFTYFIAMTLGIMGMHKIGGFKYAGLDKKGVELYRKELANFKAKHAAGLLGNKKAYKFASKRLDVALGARNIKNPITKLLHKIGKFINMGNECKPAYKSASKWNMNWLRKIANKNLIGVPLRVWIPMFLVTPFLAKLTTKTVHKILGKPTHSVLDEDKEPEKDNKQNTAANNPAQAGTPPMQGQMQPQQTITHRKPNEYSSDTNLIKMAANGQKAPQTAPVQAPAQQPQAAAQQTPPQMPTANQQQNTVNSTDSNKEMEPVRTYIPSPVSMVQPTQADMSGIDAALAKVDSTEQYVNQVLKSV